MSEWVISSDADKFAASFLVQASLNPQRMAKLARDSADFIIHASVGFLAPHTRTGNLARSMKRGTVERIGSTYRVSVGFGPTARYAKWVELGTGLYIDPMNGTPHLIYPKTATVMSWREKGAFATAYTGSHIWSQKIKGGKNPQYKIFAHHTKGQHAVHFLRDAFLLAEKTYIPARIAQLGSEMTKVA